MDETANTAIFNPFGLEDGLIPKITILDDTKQIQLCVCPINGPLERFIVGCIDQSDSIKNVEITNSLHHPAAGKYFENWKVKTFGFWSIDIVGECGRRTNQTMENCFKIQKHHPLFETFKNERADTWTFKYIQHYPAMCARFVSQIGRNNYEMNRKKNQYVDSTNKTKITKTDAMLHQLFDQFLDSHQEFKYQDAKIDYDKIVQSYETFKRGTNFDAKVIKSNIKQMHKKLHVNNRAKFVHAVVAWLTHETEHDSDASE